MIAKISESFLSNVPFERLREYDRLAYAIQRRQAGRRHAAGDARYAHPADAGARTRAWAHHRACDRAAVGRTAAGGARIALSGALPAGGARLDRILLGHHGK